MKPAKITTAFILAAMPACAVQPPPEIPGMWDRKEEVLVTCYDDSSPPREIIKATGGGTFLHFDCIVFEGNPDNARIVTSQFLNSYNAEYTSEQNAGRVTCINEYRASMPLRPDAKCWRVGP